MLWIGTVHIFRVQLPARITAQCIKANHTLAWPYAARAQIQKEDQFVGEIHEDTQQDQLIEQQDNPLHYAVVQQSSNQPSDKPKQDDCGNYGARMMGKKLDRFEIDPMIDTGERLLRVGYIPERHDIRNFGRCAKQEPKRCSFSADLAAMPDVRRSAMQEQGSR